MEPGWMGPGLDSHSGSVIMLTCGTPLYWLQKTPEFCFSSPLNQLEYEMNHPQSKVGQPRRETELFGSTVAPERSTRSFGTMHSCSPRTGISVQHSERTAL